MTGAFWKSQLPPPPRESGFFRATSRVCVRLWKVIVSTWSTQEHNRYMIVAYHRLDELRKWFEILLYSHLSLVKSAARFPRVYHLRGKMSIGKLKSENQKKPLLRTAVTHNKRLKKTLIVTYHSVRPQGHSRCPQIFLSRWNMVKKRLSQRNI
jgi:hypothetical protein